ncbi:IclR family transcriptional regulator [Maritimibacter sp. DP1N21-5]|uniref:IclR family transcriptional regulator n=1 Tax=Maritimibacter sp. DP1N21-5 TaxID=2836867 RepID=UPI001C4417E7|nr:IclR family transcriptional regulator C-terminal domain-containing protein [Maritimibacter sp. DP1N21-5]MBV7407387.1 helix-turn-helix domain-containing protein [Maritimibacter sp. DP1N21-5]
MTEKTFAATLAKGLTVLGCFEAQSGPLTLPALGVATGFDRATLRRLVLTLEAEGFLVRDGRGFRLAPRVLTLGGGYLTGLDVGRRVQPVLRHAADALNLEVALATLDRGRAVYVDRAAPASARVTLGLSVGSTLPLLHTAVGRMLLARAGSGAMETALSAPIPRHTEATVTDATTLREEIVSVGIQEYAVVSGEFEAGAAGVAVPVGALGDVPFTLSTTASTNRLSDPETLDQVLDVLRQASLSIGRIGA